MRLRNVQIFTLPPLNPNQRDSAKNYVNELHLQALLGLCLFVLAGCLTTVIFQKFTKV